MTLFQLLQKWRNEEALGKNIPRYRIAPDHQLRDIAKGDITTAAWAYLLRKLPRT